MPSAGPPTPPLVRTTAGRWAVPVPWEKADDLRAKLRRRGLSTTACLDPEARTAALEPWPGVDVGRLLGEVHALLSSAVPLPIGYRRDAGHHPTAHPPAARVGTPVRVSA